MIKISSYQHYKMPSHKDPPENLQMMSFHIAKASISMTKSDLALAQSVVHYIPALVL